MKFSREKFHLTNAVLRDLGKINPIVPKERIEKTLGIGSTLFYVKKQKRSFLLKRILEERSWTV